MDSRSARKSKYVGDENESTELKEYHLYLNIHIKFLLQDQRNLRHNLVHASEKKLIFIRQNHIFVRNFHSTTKNSPKTSCNSVIFL